MPIYEYKCPKCGVVEVMQGIKEAPLKKCPNCKRKVERMMSSTSFVLKGTGWYATDYAKKTPPPAEASGASNGTNGTASTGEASKGEASKGEASKSGNEKSASSSDTKSASSSETKPSASSEKSASSAKPTSSGKSD
jgi:putative FmdB family regulatory protein